MATNRKRILWLAGLGMVTIVLLLLAGSYRSPFPKVLESLLELLTPLCFFQKVSLVLARGHGAFPYRYGFPDGHLVRLQHGVDPVSGGWI